MMRSEERAAKERRDRMLAPIVQACPPALAARRLNIEQQRFLRRWGISATRSHYVADAGQGPRLYASSNGFTRRLGCVQADPELLARACAAWDAQRVGLAALPEPAQPCRAGVIR